jgi:hypothetical protein
MNVTAVDWRFRVWRMELRNSLMTHPSLWAFLQHRWEAQETHVWHHNFMFVSTVAVSNCLAPSVGVHSINSIVTKSIIGLEALLWMKSHHKRLSQSSAFSCDGIQVRFWVTYVQICGCMMQIGTEVWKRDTLLLLICLKVILHAWQLQPS